MRHRFSALLPVSGAFCALLTVASAAHADLTVVSESTITGVPTALKAAGPMPDFSKPIATTSYYKGDKMRTESPGSVIITTGGTDSHLVTLNPAAKTYYINPSPEAAMADNPFAAMMTFSTEGSNVRKTDEKKTILSKEAGKYDIYVPLKMGELLTIKITGEEWTSDAVAAPAAASGSSMGMLGKMMQGPMAGGLKAMTTKMATIKGFPLLTLMTMTFVIPDDSPLTAMADSIPKKMAFRSEAKSLSEDAISDDLFLIPADYKKIDPPSMMAGLPGGGGDAAPAAPPAPVAPPVVAPPTATP